MVQRGRRVYILFKDGNLVGVWSNLKYLSDDMAAAMPFPAYSTLSKMDKLGGRLEFSKGGAQFIIYIETLR